MRLGCLGCLLVGVALTLVGIAAAGVIFLSSNIFAEPDDVPAVNYTRADGFRAQQKLYEVLLRDGHRSGRQDPIVLTEVELNAFLARHLEEAAGLPLAPVAVSILPNDVVELRGRTVLKNLMQGIPFAQLAPYLPQRRAELPVWVRVRGQIKFEPGAPRREREYAQLDVTDFALGTQPIGAWVLKLMLGQASRTLLRWPIPNAVQGITTEDGRLVVRASPP